MKMQTLSSALKYGALALALGSSLGLAGSAAAEDPVTIIMGPWDNPWPFNYTTTKTLTKGAANVAVVKVTTGNAYRATYEAKTAAGNATNNYKGSFRHYCVAASPGDTLFGPDLNGKTAVKECGLAWLGFDLLITAEARVQNQ